MGLVTGVTLPANGDRIKAENYNDPINKIIAQVNGQLDGSNISSLPGTKITAGSIPRSALDSTNFSAWYTLGVTPSSVTYNGQRSYDIAVPSDQTATLSPGMRLRTTRTTQAPTQSALLNGTSQYFSKSSPSGMTATNNLTFMARVKLTSYPTGTGTIVSRLDATGVANGFSLQVNSSGQVILIGRVTSSANYKILTTYQSLPLNTWVSISATLDYSSFTSATNKIYFDEVEVVCSFNSGGTITAIGQTGDYCIGARTGGADFFPGKIAQVAVFSANLSASTIRSYVSQSFVGTETNLISAHSLSNSLVDLNTTNANNLTANGAATTTNADAPFGNQADGSVSSTLDYAIIQKITSTTITVQVPEGCTITTSGSISAISYSYARNPYGFPSQRGKWAITTKVKISITGSMSTSYGQVLAGLGITVPTGEWAGGYKASMYYDRTTPDQSGYLTLSTSTTTETNDDFTTASSTTLSSATGNMFRHSPAATNEQPLSASSATQYYLLMKVGASGSGGVANSSPFIIRFYNAFL